MSHQAFSIMPITFKRLQSRKWLKTYQINFFLASWLWKGRCSVTSGFWTALKNGNCDAWFLGPEEPFFTPHTTQTVSQKTLFKPYALVYLITRTGMSTRGTHWTFFWVYIVQLGLIFDVWKKTWIHIFGQCWNGFQNGEQYLFLAHG